MADSNFAESSSRKRELFVFAGECIYKSREKICKYLHMVFFAKIYVQTAKCVI